MSPSFAVVMSTDGDSRLGVTLRQLVKQLFSDCGVFIWNNRKEESRSVDAICSRAATKKHPIHTVHSQHDIGGRGRQLLARYLRLKHGYRYALFVPGNQLPPLGLIPQLWGERQACSIVSTFVSQYTGDSWPGRVVNAAATGNFCSLDYAIADTELFAYDQYWALWPEKYWGCDDIWCGTMANALSVRLVQANWRMSYKRAKTKLDDELLQLMYSPQQGRHGKPLYIDSLP